MVLDDSSSAAQQMRDILIKAGYDVEIYVDPREAQDDILNEDKHFDLLVFDINMTPIDGVTLAKRLRNEGFLTPVCFVTGEQANGITAAAISVANSELMEKENISDELNRKCRDLLSQGHLYIQWNQTNECMDELKGTVVEFIQEMRLERKDVVTKDSLEIGVKQVLVEHCPAMHNNIENDLDLMVEDAVGEALEPDQPLHDDIRALVNVETQPGKLVDRAKKNSIVLVALGLVTFIATGLFSIFGYGFWQTVTISTKVGENGTRIDNHGKQIDDINDELKPLRGIPSQMQVQMVQMQNLQETIDRAVPARHRRGRMTRGVVPKLSDEDLKRILREYKDRMRRIGHSFGRMRGTTSTSLTTRVVDRGYRMRLGVP
jgi:DNA-binding response OmpR family regulator